MKKDPIGFFVMTILVIVGLMYLVDWSTFTNFGKTSPVHKKEPFKKLRGFGPQCDFDEPIVPCTYRYVVRQGEK